MSDQKISPIVREALWIAHAKKCAYTRELIDVSDMQVDHIIPERLANKPAELAATKSALNLDDSFDLFGLENLLPTKAGPNLQKSQGLLTPSASRYFLSIAATKKPIVELHIEKIERRMQSGYTMIILRQLIDAGHVQEDALPKLLSGPSEAIFKLARSAGFANEVPVESISKSEIDNLKTKPIRFGANDHIHSLTLGMDSSNGPDKEVEVRTCWEYEAALKAGYYARNTYEIKMSVFFEHQCGLLTALGNAVLPSKSFVAEPRVGLPDLHLIPLRMFPNVAEPEGRERADPKTSYQDKVDAGEMTVKRVGSNLLSIEFEGFGQHLVEVVRADFSGNGLEEIMVYESSYATQGTFGSGGILLLSRNSPDGMFESKSI